MSMIARAYNPYKDLQIVIPSSGRANKFYSIKELSEKALDNTVLQVPHTEFLEYEEKYIQMVRICKHHAERIPTIAHVRELLIERYCAENKKRYLLILDDDFRFFYRPNPKDWHLRYLQEAGKDAFDRMMGEIMHHVKKHRFAHTSLSLRQGNHLIKEDWSYNKRYSGFLLYDLYQLKKIHLRRIPTQQDFDIALQLLRKGKPSAIMYKYAIGEMMGNNAEGGASPYRTLKMQDKASKMLAKFHPGFVKVVKKFTKSSWGGNTERTDVLMFHKKAFESSGLTIEEYLDGNE